MTDQPDISDIVRHPEFTADQLEGHRAMLHERVFQVDTKWPHFSLLLGDIAELASAIEPGSTVVSLERGMLYGGISLVAPFFAGCDVIAADCSPQSADNRGAYNRSMVDDDRVCCVESSIRVDIENTGLPDAIADLVVVPNLVHHVPDQDALFGEIVRLLKPRGRAYVFEPLVRELHQMPDDYLRYTPFGMRRKFEQFGLIDCSDNTEGGAFSAIAYCWAQALEYFPEDEREKMSDWFYKEEFPRLIKWDETYRSNQVRQHTAFPMAFSVQGVKPS